MLAAGLALTVGVLAAGATPSAGVIHWWKADGDAVDSIAGNNGTLLGDTTFAAGHSAQAFSFDGAGDVVNVPPPNPDDLLFSGSFTVDVWVKTSQAPPLAMVVSKYECANFCPPTAAADWEIQLLNGSVAGFIRDTDAGGPDPSGGQYVTVGSSIADGNFHHIMLARDMSNSALCLTVDAQSVSNALTPGASGPLTSTDGEDDPLTIGAYISGGTSTYTGFLTGLVDDLKLSDTGACGPPTAVSVASFTARLSGSGVVVRWRTAGDASFVGFNVYRDGVRVNRHLILAVGGVVSYRVRDARPGTVYRLQGVRAGGARSWIATVTVS
jgi:hypothetical protein